MRTPLVSVVIPAYNAAATLDECLESVMGQGYPELEVVLVDDGSTDDTALVVKRFGDRVRYVYQRNAGLAAARNTGHREARGEFVAWLDADDVCEPYRIALQAEYLAAHDHIGLVSSEFSAFNGDGIIADCYARQYYGALDKSTPEEIYGSSESYSPLMRDWFSRDIRSVEVFAGAIYEKLVWGNFIHPPTVMVRRSIIDAVGVLDPTLPNCEDWDFFIRLSRIAEIAYIDMPLLRYRRHPGQLSDMKNMRQHVLVWIAVQEKIRSSDPEMAERYGTRMRRQLGEWHSFLALQTAETERTMALVHLIKALTHGIVWRTSLRALGQILLPRIASSGLRRLRQAVRQKWVMNMPLLIQIQCELADLLYVDGMGIDLL